MHLVASIRPSVCLWTLSRMNRFRGCGRSAFNLNAAIDNLAFYVLLLAGRAQTNKQTNGHYQIYYLPALWSIKMFHIMNDMVAR